MSHGKAYTLDDRYIYTYGIEYYLAEHCNLACKGCSQSSPYANKKISTLADFAFCLEKIEPCLRPDRITFLGGEPLLNRGIIDFIKLAKESRIFNRILLTTNGLLLEKAPSEMWKLLDGIEVSLYPANQNLIFKYANFFLQRAKENNTELTFSPKDNFNHILFSTKIPQELVKLVFKKCYYKNYTHTLHDKKFYKCSPGTLSSHYLKHFVAVDSANEDDYIDLEKTIVFKDDLIRYLEKDMPLSACSFCAGSSGKTFPHQQLQGKAVSNNEFNINKLDIYE